MSNTKNKGTTNSLSLYSQYIHQTRYARWNDEHKRRETWPESVDRYIDYITEQAKKHEVELGRTAKFLRDKILNLEAMPSMRAFMTSGTALDRDNVAGYNCAYVTVDDVRAFDETMYILMCGTGIGFSVERQYVNRLPEVPEQLFDVEDVIVVADSRKGWAGGYKRLLAALYSGHVPAWDLSKLRPAGARLKTFGGRSSGPAPLDALFRYTVDVFKHATGRKLTSLECHGLMCKIGDVVVSGGVRRSALISLSNPSDERMRDAKSGNWYEDENKKHYQLANNSAAWTEKPDPGRFMDEWTALYKSNSGERGIINRTALQKKAAESGRRNAEYDFGVNPCSEIILRPNQFCNLTEIVARADDTLDDLKDKAEAATIMGCIQSTLTDFKYLRAVWKNNCEEERLLGVSITGQQDHPVLAKTDEECAEWEETLKKHVIATAQKWSKKLGINMPAATTCQKPSGTVSQLVDAASGGHKRHAKFYIRRTRDSKADAIAQVVMVSGVPYEEDVMKPENYVFEWPIAAPVGSSTEWTAVEQLEKWLHTAKHWCEHKPSVTVTVKEDEWLAVGAFVYDHFDEMSGVSFLPDSGHIYQQPPYEEITEEEYNARIKEMPTEIDWTLLEALEVDDETKGSHELACVSGSCEI